MAVSGWVKSFREQQGPAPVPPANRHDQYRDSGGAGPLRQPSPGRPYEKPGHGYVNQGCERPDVSHRPAPVESLLPPRVSTASCEARGTAGTAGNASPASHSATRAAPTDTGRHGPAGNRPRLREREMRPAGLPRHRQSARKQTNTCEPVRQVRPAAGTGLRVQGWPPVKDG